MTYPLQALLDATRSSRRQFAIKARISGSEVARLDADGLTDAEADRYAVRCGLPTAFVWPEWTLNALTPLERVFDGMRTRGAA